ncbi:MAG: cell wall-binding repeat-containing protein [Coriobacteriia bacterium]|nr:cell wall-binding repeat-containing protein [Coriobacteriia bacterium]
MHTSRHIARAVITVLAATLLGASPASAAVVGYFARDGAQEAILSEMAIHPAALRVGSVTYLGYQGPGFDPYVAAYDEGSDAWHGPRRIGTNPLRLDAHGAPSLYLDPAGRVHAFFGSHWTPMLHARQVRSAPDSAWESAASLPAGTYPQAVRMPDGDLELYYRDSGGNWAFTASADGAATFGAPVRVLAADSATGWYADFRMAGNGTLHAVFTWFDLDLQSAGREFVRRNLYYASRGTDGVWRGASGSALTLPITRAQADARCLLVDSGARFVNEMSVKADRDGAPCVIYLLGSGSGPGAYEWRFLRRDDAGWRGGTITTTDHYFDAAALDPQPDGTLEAFVVTGDSDARDSVDGDYRGRGGRIERWTSADDGGTWARAGRISPVESGVLYSDPVLVSGGSSAARLMFTDWTDDESAAFHRLFLWGEDGLVARDTPAVTARLAGPDRRATAIQVSRTSFPAGSRAVIVATDSDFPDALAGAQLAAAVNGPVLLTPTDALPAAVSAEITRLGARTVFVLGGERALTGRVATALSRVPGVTSVERLGGVDRYATALAIARRARDRTRTITTAVVVSGRVWPDAVAAGALAAANDWPIVLADGDRLPAASVAVLAEYGIAQTIIVGQTEAVGPSVESVAPSPTRIGGADRYETAALLAEYALDRGLLPGRALVATGRDFPDALTAGPLGGRARAPVLLVDPADASAPALAYIGRHADQITDLWLVGEDDALPASFENAAMRLLE